jgi:hypothetical protein
MCRKRIKFESGWRTGHVPHVLEGSQSPGHCLKSRSFSLRSQKILRSGTSRETVSRQDRVVLDAMFSAAIDHFGDIDIACPGAGAFKP